MTYWDVQHGGTSEILVIRAMKLESLLYVMYATERLDGDIRQLEISWRSLNSVK